MSKWKALLYCRRDIQLKPVLLGGQSFRWKSLKEDDYIGVINNSVWELKQSDEKIEYQVLSTSTSQKNCDKILRKYLRLDVDLNKLYTTWSTADPIFSEAGQKFYGIRMLDQDVIENVFSFICSSNNNIARISSMVEKLCRMYGKLITKIDEDEFYTFPNVSSMVGPKVEAELRKAGFGYRAKFISQTADKIHSIGEEEWVRKLKTLSYEDAKAELMKLPGVGAKVADCICLMSLSHLNAIPVDTHVFQIFKKNYPSNLDGTKTVTNRVYNEIAHHFQELFGEHAGWAHTILFCDDLKKFKASEKRKKDSTDDINHTRKKR